MFPMRDFKERKEGGKERREGGRKEGHHPFLVFLTMGLVNGMERSIVIPFILLLPDSQLSLLNRKSV